MTDILFHRARIAARELTNRLDAILAGLGISSAEQLREKLSAEVHDKPSLVFTGQYSSGKSTLIRALTDGAADVVIDSDISTDSIEAFDWSDVVTLIDTPGVQAGVRQHDELAEDALRTADLVLFTVTVELFDDALQAHLHHVLGDLDRARQTLVVLTKSTTMPAARGVREAAMRDALGQYAGVVPWVECDAAYYLRGLEMMPSDPLRAEQYIAASGLSQVKALINTVARDRGQLARFQQPLQQIMSVLTEADALLVADPAERSALTILARQRAALSSRRERLETVLNRHALDFRAECISEAGSFADKIERLESDGESDEADVQLALATLNDGLDAAAQRLKEGVERSIEVQFSDLSSELSQIEASPHAKVLIDLTEPNFDSEGSAAVSVKARSRRPLESPNWAPHVREYLKHFQDFWGAGSGSGVAASSGTMGHKIVLEVGHFFGKKFKPWEAVRTASHIGKAVKVGGAVLSLGIEAYGVYREERAAVREEAARTARRRALTFEVLRQCDEIADGALRGARQVLDGTFNGELNRIDTVIAEIQAARAQRSETSQALQGIAKEARKVLSDLAGRDDTQLVIRQDLSAAP